MTIDQKISQYTRRLPPSLQEELFDFVQYLLMKAEQKERREWFSLSLCSAIQDMEDDPNLYTLEDIKVNFS
jgi:hypothetical protein